MSGLRSQMVLNFGDGGSVARALELLGCHARGGNIYQDHEEAWYDPCGHFQLVDTKAKNMATAEISFGKQASKTRAACQHINDQIESLVAERDAHAAELRGINEKIAVGVLTDNAVAAHHRRTTHFMSAINKLIGQRAEAVRDCTDAQFLQKRDELEATIARSRSAMAAVSYRFALEAFEKAKADLRTAKANGYSLERREAAITSTRDALIGVRRQLQQEATLMWPAIVQLRLLRHYIAGLEPDETITGCVTVCDQQPIGGSAGSVDRIFILPYFCTPIFKPWTSHVDDDTEACLTIGL